MKKFVIVVPGYNYSKWYDKCLLSVINQKYDNYRVIFTDDCSSDGSGDLVKKFLEKYNINIRAMARKLGITHTQLRRIANNESGASLEVAIEIVMYSGQIVDIYSLLPFDGYELKAKHNEYLKILRNISDDGLSSALALERLHLKQKKKYD